MDVILILFIPFILMQLPRDHRQLSALTLVLSLLSWTILYAAQPREFGTGNSQLAWGANLALFSVFLGASLKYIILTIRNRDKEDNRIIILSGLIALMSFFIPLLTAEILRWPLPAI